MRDAGDGEGGDCLRDYLGERNRKQKAVQLWFREVVLKVWSPAAGASPGNLLDVQIPKLYLQNQKVCIFKKSCRGF